MRNVSLSGFKIVSSMLENGEVEHCLTLFLFLGANGNQVNRKAIGKIYSVAFRIGTPAFSTKLLASDHFPKLALELKKRTRFIQKLSSLEKAE